jgi:microcystin-dependent protein
MSSNLGVNALEAKIEQYLKIIVPIGTVVAFAGASIPEGWLLCEGVPVSKTTYSELFDALGSSHGDGTQNADGTPSGFSGTHFNLPDYRGRFLRGVDGTAGNDPDKASRTASAAGGNTGNGVGSVQADENKLHGHPSRYNQQGSASADLTGGFMINQDSVINRAEYTGTPTNIQGQQIGGSGGSEARPKNANVNYIIRAV